MRALANVIVLGAGVGAGLGGCDGEVDLTGVYRVDVELASAPCGNDAPVADGYAYLRFSRGELFGTPYFAYAACSDETATDCSSVGGLFEGFFEPIDGGWLGNATYSSSSGLNCTLWLTEKTAILDGSRLEIELHSYQALVELPNAECTPEEAETRGAEMPCAQHHLIEATRL
jgi:hypothetical protein